MTVEKNLHIVSYDVPYPVNYGGVFDIFYSLVALHQAGINIHLHCFDYGRGKQPELEKYCVSVNYYSRNTGHKGFSHKLPYIVCSRANADLLDNLLNDDYPILAEGIHCSYLLTDDRFSGRKIFVRLLNAEFEYYHRLSKVETSPVKKFYYWHESKMLKKFERRIAQRAQLLAISQRDVETYQREFPGCSIKFLPAFLPEREVKSSPGQGCYCLYHGNLSVAENEYAAAWLLKKVFNDISVPLVIAGKDPSAHLIRLAYRNRHTCIVANPSDSEMGDIIAKAQLNILPSFNNTGVKLKLLNALYLGKHCLVNNQTVEGTGLEMTCHIANNQNDFKKAIAEYFEVPFSNGEIKERADVLGRYFNNQKNAEQLIAWIW